MLLGVEPTEHRGDDLVIIALLIHLAEGVASPVPLEVGSEFLGSAATFHECHSGAQNETSTLHPKSDFLDSVSDDPLDSPNGEVRIKNRIADGLDVRESFGVYVKAIECVQRQSLSPLIAGIVHLTFHDCQVSVWFASSEPTFGNAHMTMYGNCHERLFGG